MVSTQRSKLGDAFIGSSHEANSYRFKPLHTNRRGGEALETVEQSQILSEGDVLNINSNQDCCEKDDQKKGGFYPTLKISEENASFDTSLTQYQTYQGMTAQSNNIMDQISRDYNIFSRPGQPPQEGVFSFETSIKKEQHQQAIPRQFISIGGSSGGTLDPLIRHQQNNLWTIREETSPHNRKFNQSQVKIFRDTQGQEVSMWVEGLQVSEKLQSQISFRSQSSSAQRVD